MRKTNSSLRLDINKLTVVAVAVLTISACASTRLPLEMATSDETALVRGSARIFASVVMDTSRILGQQRVFLQVIDMIH